MENLFKITFEIGGIFEGYTDYVLEIGNDTVRFVSSKFGMQTEKKEIDKAEVIDALKRMILMTGGNTMISSGLRLPCLTEHSGKPYLNIQMDIGLLSLPEAMIIPTNLRNLWNCLDWMVVRIQANTQCKIL